jgi:protein-S-isoprenylcysteine O-methyltransferase Ste14
LIIFGIAIRLIAIRTLGKFFTVNLNLAEDHLLIKNGLYKYLRHPSYSGSLLSFLGFGISLNNWPALIVIFVPVLLSFIYRINIEEKLMSVQFGNDYDEYKKQTKRLVPLIY